MVGPRAPSRHPYKRQASEQDDQDEDLEVADREQALGRQQAEEGYEGVQRRSPNIVGENANKRAGKYRRVRIPHAALGVRHRGGDRGGVVGPGGFGRAHFIPTSRAATFQKYAEAAGKSFGTMRNAALTARTINVHQSSRLP